MAVIALYVLYGKWYKSGPYILKTYKTAKFINKYLYYLHVHYYIDTYLFKKKRKKKKEIQLDIVKLNV